MTDDEEFEERAVREASDEAALWNAAEVAETFVDSWRREAWEWQDWEDWK